MTRRNGSNASGDWSGRPSFGLRALRWTIAAPASAAASADEAISAAVTGKWGDIDGVWIDPVTAQEMMILRDAMMFLPYRGFTGGGADVDREVPARRVAIAVINQ